jgi:O-glycosyl hydrolase
VTLDKLRQRAMRGAATASLHLDILFGSDRGPRHWRLHRMFFSRCVFTADGSHQTEWKALGIEHRRAPATRLITTPFSRRASSSTTRPHRPESATIAVYRENTLE